MWRQHDRVECQQGRTLRWLVRIDVKRRAGQMITLQSVAKCRLIDQCATRAIDQAGARLHLRKTHSVNKIACLIRQRAVETHVIRSRQQRIKRDRLSTRLFDNFRRHERIVSEDLHFEREA